MTDREKERERDSDIDIDLLPLEPGMNKKIHELFFN